MFFPPKMLQKPRWNTLARRNLRTLFVFVGNWLLRLPADTVSNGAGKKVFTCSPINPQ